MITMKEQQSFVSLDRFNHYRYSNPQRSLSLSLSLSHLKIWKI